MQITGRLLEIQPTKVVSDKFRTREFWIETNDQYPQTLAIQLTNDNCEKFKVLIGSQVTCEINLRGRQWTSPQGERKVFNTIECWKWKGEEQQQHQTQAPQEAGGGDDDSEMPF
jgi:single-strand DNA-binding protein